MTGLSHIALNVRDLERAKRFYVNYFDAEASFPHYQNPRTGLETCFLTFGDGNRLELMAWPEMTKKLLGAKVEGFVHIAFSLGSTEAVDALTKRLGTNGFAVLSGPRTTGDGYYESLIQDPEGNLIEITV
ncbi:MAG TPA: VOC family protein [Anaerolineaceae bacterium]|nr:VOC family protein [Anaerolineaceae bacterium]